METNLTVTLTVSELKEIIAEAVSQAMQENRPRVPEPPQPEYMNTEQAANYLHVTLGTLYHYRMHGSIPYYKRNSKLYFKKSELEAFINEGRHLTNKQLYDDFNNL